MLKTISYKFQNKYINKKAVFFMLFVVLFFFVGIKFVSAAWYDFAVDGFGSALVAVISGILGVFVKLFGELLLFFIGALIKIIGFFYVPQSVSDGWTIVRDLANMFFIVILMIIAISTVLRIESFNYKKMLPKLLLMAILINFSKMFTLLLIDLSQIVTLTFLSSFESAGPGNFIEALGLGDVMKLADSAKNGTVINLGDIIGSMFLSIIFLIIACIVVFSLFIIFIIRIIAFWILIVLSPMAYLASATGSVGSQYSGQWWTTFTKYLIVGPVLAFFLWLSLSIMASKTVMVTPNVTGVGVAVIGTSDSIMRFIVSIAMLLGSLVAAQQIGVAGASTAKGLATKGIKRFGSMTGRGALRAGGRAVEGVGYGAGWAIDKMNPSKDTSERDKRIPLMDAKIADKFGISESDSIVKNERERIISKIEKRSGKKFGVKDETSGRRALSAPGRFLSQWGADASKKSSKADTASLLRKLEQAGMDDTSLDTLQSMTGSTAGQATSKIAIGAAIGSVVPGVGTLVGAGIGAGVQTVGYAAKKGGEKMGDRFGGKTLKDFGSFVSGLTTKTITSAGKKGSKETKDARILVANAANEESFMEDSSPSSVYSTKLTDAQKKYFDELTSSSNPDAPKGVSEIADWINKAGKFSGPGKGFDDGKEHVKLLRGYSKGIAAYKKGGNDISPLKSIVDAIAKRATVLKDPSKLKTVPEYDASVVANRRTGKVGIQGSGNLSVNSFGRGQSDTIAYDFNKFGQNHGFGHDFDADQEGAYVNDRALKAKIATNISADIDLEIGKLHGLKSAGKVGEGEGFEMKQGGFDEKMKSLRSAKQRLSDPNSLKGLELVNSAGKNYAKEEVVKTKLHEGMHGKGVKSELVAETMAQDISKGKVYSQSSELGNLAAEMEEKGDSEKNIIEAMRTIIHKEAGTRAQQVLKQEWGEVPTGDEYVNQFVENKNNNAKTKIETLNNDISNLETQYKNPEILNDKKEDIAKEITTKEKEIKKQEQIIKEVSPTTQIPAPAQAVAQSTPQAQTPVLEAVTTEGGQDIQQLRNEISGLEQQYKASSFTQEKEDIEKQILIKETQIKEQEEISQEEPTVNSHQDDKPDQKDDDEIEAKKKEKNVIAEIPEMADFAKKMEDFSNTLKEKNFSDPADSVARTNANRSLLMSLKNLGKAIDGNSGISAKTAKAITGLTGSVDEETSPLEIKVVAEQIKRLNEDV